jgi:hypothetical protein
LVAGSLISLSLLGEMGHLFLYDCHSLWNANFPVIHLNFKPAFALRLDHLELACFPLYMLSWRWVAALKGYFTWQDHFYSINFF